MNAGNSTAEANREALPVLQTGMKRKHASEGPPQADEDDNNSDTRDDDEKETERQLDNLKLEDKLKARTQELHPTVLRDGACKTSSAYFVEVWKHMEKFWPPELTNLEGIIKAVTDFEAIPYLGDCLKSHLDDAKQCLGSLDQVDLSPEDQVELSPEDQVELSPEDQVELSPEDQAVLALLNKYPDKEKQAIRETFLKKERELQKKERELQKKDREVQKKDREVQKKDREVHIAQSRAACFGIIQQVQCETREVRDQLLALAGLSQAEGTVTETRESLAKSQRTGDGIPTNRGNFVVAEPQSLYSSVIENSEDIEKVLPGLCLPSSDSKAQQAEQKIQSVAKLLDCFLSKSTILADSNKNYQKDVQEGLESLRKELTSFSRSSTAATSNRCSSVPEAAPASKFTYVPGPVAHEKDGTQPFFQLLLQVIGECWDPSTASLSPQKNNVRREAPIPGTAKRPKRTTDFLLQKEGRWNAVIFDDTLTVPVEVKPGCRKGPGPQALLNEARDQCFSHLAKHLFIGFSFASYGVPCHATGIIANMAAVQILHLRYEKVGTPSAKLTLYESDILPLMTLKNFQRWAALAKSKETKFDELEKKLFGLKGEDGMDKHGVPKGIRILFNLMNQPSKKLHGLSVDAESGVLGDQLGTGAAAVVFRRGGAEKPNSVVKLSRYEVKTDIENEYKILKELASNEHIPSIIYSMAIEGRKLPIKLGSVSMELPAIELEPAGKKAASVFLSSERMDKDLRLVLDGITSALNHMHSRSIYHCDVAPKNIIFAGGENDQRAVLIDYSISSIASDPRIKGFRGTPNYVHRDIFLSTLDGRRGWEPRPEYDKVGLGFALVFFANRCMRSWNVGDYPKTVSKPKEHKDDLKAVMRTRLIEAKTKVKNAVTDHALKDAIDTLLNCDEFTYQKWTSEQQTTDVA